MTLYQTAAKLSIKNSAWNRAVPVFKVLFGVLMVQLKGIKSDGFSAVI